MTLGERPDKVPGLAGVRSSSPSWRSGLREHVLPFLGSHAGRAHVQAGAGGDVTFAIDEEAEAFLERSSPSAPPTSRYYSEDRGLGHAEPRALGAPGFPPKEIPVLLVDPIDGTRPAMAGLESCCVSVAAAPLGDGEPDDGRRRRAACVVEIKSGARVRRRARAGPGDPSAERRSASARSARTTTCRGCSGPSASAAARRCPLITVLAELIDTSSVGGAVFDLGSATFDMTRLVTGQLDAYVDVGSRMIEEAPALRDKFEEVGGGAVLNNSPYDLAAAVLCLEEAGAVVTDARGDPLAARPLLGSGHEYQMSCVAAANPALHARMMEVARARDSQNSATGT